MDAGPAPAHHAPATASRSPAPRHTLLLVLALLAVAVISSGVAIAAFQLLIGWKTVMAIALVVSTSLWLLLRQRRQRAPDCNDASFQQLATTMPDAVVITDGHALDFANPAARRLLALDTTAYAKDLMAVAAMPPTVANGPVPCALPGRDGQVLQCSVMARPMPSAGHGRHLFVVHDLSEIECGRAALATSNAELQAMAGRLFSLQEDERRSISRDLHDDIGQAITAIKLAACAARDEADAPRRQGDIDQIIELADSTVTKLRNLSMLLRPPQLDALGLEAALRWQANMLFRSTPVELLLDVGALPRRPSNEVEQACFRIAQESLTNALRHARASQVSLQLRAAGEAGLQLRVVDDGEGFDPDGPRGLGMIVMRERAQSAGGSLSIETAPGEGTCISLHLPYADAAH